MQATHVVGDVADRLLQAPREVSRLRLAEHELSEDADLNGDASMRG
jgi:hypothetical protein